MLNLSIFASILRTYHSFKLLTFVCFAFQLASWSRRILIEVVKRRAFSNTFGDVTTGRGYELQTLITLGTKSRIATVDTVLSTPWSNGTNIMKLSTKNVQVLCHCTIREFRTILFKCHFDNHQVYLKRMLTLRSVKRFLFPNFGQKDFLISGPVIWFFVLWDESKDTFACLYSVGKKLPFVNLCITLIYFIGLSLLGWYYRIAFLFLKNMHHFTIT